MDNEKIGRLIYKLRKENNLTQLRLANMLNISDKTISKWERGLGCPDISLLTELSAVFNVDLEKLLCGELGANEVLGGNMKKMNFYVCPECGNVVVSMTETAVTCCGRKLKAETARKASAEEALSVELIENEYYITNDHPMTKEHYIAFVAFLSGDTLIMKKQYPEWNLQTRLPRIARGKLLWYCTEHGLFYQLI